jgi:ankyrin repeat protein
MSNLFAKLSVNARPFVPVGGGESQKARQAEASAPVCSPGQTTFLELHDAGLAESKEKKPILPVEHPIYTPESAPAKGADEHTKMALLFAISNRNVATTEQMLTRGADVNAVSPFSDMPEGAAPIHVCSRLGDLKMLELLLSIPSLDINKRDPALGKSALHIACGLGHTEVVEKLLSAGADPALRSNDGSTALLIAVDKKQESCALLLLESQV